MRLLPPANEVCEGYVFTVICLSTGGCLPDRDPSDRDPQTENPLDRVYPFWTETSLDRDPPYGNERTVRILLECILVSVQYLV